MDMLLAISGSWIMGSAWKMDSRIQTKGFRAMMNDLGYQLGGRILGLKNGLGTMQLSVLVGI